jgi:glucose/arabinose dehydrogenase
MTCLTQRVVLLAAIVAVCAAAATASAPPAPERVVGRLRPGLTEIVVADSIRDPVSFALAPDGRAFVCEQGGRVRVVRGGRLLPEPFLVVPTEAIVEEGLLGIAVHPDFARTPWVYVLHTAGPEPRRERLERWLASGDTAVAGSGEVLLELDVHDAHNHVGGMLRFAPDGRLLVGTGDNEREMLSQSLGSTFGKLLRLDDDGGAPAGNPFATAEGGTRAAVWARGFRNVWGFDVHPRTGRVLANDVGASAWEEVNEVVAGGNYGWPFFEGPVADRDDRAPLHAYGHDAGCAITAGAFYAPERPALPREWWGRWLFTEYCWNEIRWLDPDRPGRHGVLGTTLVPGPVDLRAGPDGALWMLLRGNLGPVGGEGTASGMLVRVEASRAPTRTPRRSAR